MIALENLTLDDFKPLVGRTVLFDQPDYKEDFVLSEVIAMRSSPPAGFRLGFIVLLDGSNPNVMIKEGLYPLKLPELGRHELFINCVGKLDNGAFQYQAVFS